MKKWVLAAAALLVFEAILVWQVRRAEKPAEPLLPVETAQAAPTPPPTTGPTRHHAQSNIRMLPTAANQDPDAPKKLDPKSDEFFERIDEVYPRRLTANAARCFHGEVTGKNKNDSVLVSFKIRVVNGQVRVLEAKALESTVKDKALESCFVEEIRRSHWQDDEMPDYEQDDEITVRFRGLKKYLQEPDTDDAVPTSSANQ